MGHGENAICGQWFYDSVYQCSGCRAAEAMDLLREVYDRGENPDLHERIRVFLDIKA